MNILPGDVELNDEKNMNPGRNINERQNGKLICADTSMCFCKCSVGSVCGVDVGLQMQMIYSPSSHRVYHVVEERVVYRNKGTLYTHSRVEGKASGTPGCGFNANDATMGRASWRGT